MAHDSLCPMSKSREKQGPLIVVCFCSALAAARQEEQRKVIERCRRWQAEFPREIIPWQIVFIREPSLTKAEVERAQELWDAIRRRGAP